MSVNSIIDCHQHVFWLGKDDQFLIDYLDSIGVTRCWLLSWEAVDGGLDHAYQHLSIREVFQTWERFPDRIIPCAGVDCRRPDAERMLRECHARGARGYGEIKWHLAYDCPDAIRMFRLAGELGMPVTLHLQYPNPKLPNWWYGGHIGSIERALRLCPETVFLGHAQSWWAHISGDADNQWLPNAYPPGPVTPGGEVVRLLSEHDNIYADLSGGSGYNGLTRDPDFGRQFVIDFADKLLYGVDNYDDRLITLLRGWDLPEDVFAKVTSLNACKLMGEPDDSPAK
jgi:hypothetical protein